MIKYMHHSIRETLNISTNRPIFALMHWYFKTDNPDICCCRHYGYFKSAKEAEDKHNDLIVKGLGLDRDF